MRRSIRKRSRREQQQRRCGPARHRGRRIGRGHGDDSRRADARPRVSDRGSNALCRRLLRSQIRSDTLRKLLDGLWWSDARLQRRLLRRHLHARPHELQQRVHRHEEQPESLRCMREGMRRRSAMFERSVHVSRRDDAVQWQVCRSRERSSELRCMRNRLFRRDACLQRGQVRGYLRDRPRPVWQRLHRHEVR